MRVMMTTDTIGGVWNYATNLTANLLSVDVEVILVTVGQLMVQTQREQLQRLRASHPSSFLFIETDHPLEWMPENERTEAGMEMLNRLILQHRPDILHSNQFCYGAIPVDTPRIVVAHSDVLTWYLSCFGSEPPLDAWYSRYFSLVSSGLRGADLVVCPSRWLQEQLLQHYPVEKSRIATLHNAATENNQRSVRKMQAVSAGRLWDQGKNIRVITNALLDIPVYIAGDAGRERLQDTGFVRYLGQIGNAAMSSLLIESEIYIAPSLYEPFGLAPLEAAHAGCALVLSDIASFHELWQEDALYFNPHSPESLQLTVEKLVRDSSLRRDMAGKARKRARERYSQQRLLSDYLSLYKETINRSMKTHVA